MKRRCCFSHPWLCAPLPLVSALYRWQNLQREVMVSWTSLSVEGTKRAQHMMEAQPVFLFKPGLSRYFSKGVSKPRENMLSPIRTMQLQLASQVCLLRYDHTVAARDTKTCPWLHMNGKEQKESEKNGWDLMLTPQKKQQDPHIHFSFAGPKPSPVATSPLAAAMQIHSLAGSTSPQTLLCWGDSCLFPAPEGGSQGTVSPQCDSGAEWGGTVVRPPSGIWPWEIIPTHISEAHKKIQAQDKHYHSGAWEVSFSPYITLETTW